MAGRREKTKNKTRHGGFKRKEWTRELKNEESDMMPDDKGAGNAWGSVVEELVCVIFRMVFVSKTDLCMTYFMTGVLFRMVLFNNSKMDLCMIYFMTGFGTGAGLWIGMFV